MLESRKLRHLFIAFAVLAAACLASTTAAGSDSRAGAPTANAAAAKKLCVVKKRNKKGKLVTVYKTQIKRVKVRKNGKLVTVKKRVFVYRTVTKRVKVRKNGKLVTVRKRVKVKVPKKAACKKKGTTVLGTPVTVQLTSGSIGDLDFGAFVREAPLTGSLGGYVVGSVQLNKANTIILTKGRIDIDRTAIFIDDRCGGDVSAAIQTGPKTYAVLDTSRSNTASLAATGDVTTVVHLKLRSTIELRNGDVGCTNPYLQTGYVETTLTQNLFGKLTSAGGLGVKLLSAPQLLDDFAVCLTLGDPGTECSGIEIPFPFLFSAHITAALKIGKSGQIKVPAGIKTSSVATR